MQTYRNTKQRTRILEVLRSTDTHPTAAWVYDRLKFEFPSLSLGTVYRNLTILEEQGSVVRIASGSTFDRYDAVVTPHTHFRCLMCGGLYDTKDLSQDAFSYPEKTASGHQITKMVLEFHGTCAPCLEKRPESVEMER